MHMKEFIALLLCALLTFGGLALGETEAAEESGPVLVEAGYAHSFASTAGWAQACPWDLLLTRKK